MRIIISPAKKMRTDTDSMECRDLPLFLDRAEMLCAQMQRMDAQALKKLWKCSDALVQLNMERLAHMDLRRTLTPAILAYEGIQYQYMLPEVFTDQEFDYVQAHLRILSGLYGILRPFDGVTPYRLEMQAALSCGLHKDLYAFWGDTIARTLLEKTDCILNLASKEYSLCVSRHLPASARMITCVFGEKKEDRIIEKGTLCKMARGEMVRYLAQNHITDPEQVKAFCGLNYRYSPEDSTDSTYVFLMQSKSRG